MVRTISRRSWAVPLSAGTVALLASFGLSWAYVGFAFIPLVAWALGRSVKDAA